MCLLLFIYILNLASTTFTTVIIVGGIDANICTAGKYLLFVTVEFNPLMI